MSKKARISDIRRDYQAPLFDKKNAQSNPYKQFEIWFEQILSADLMEPNVMYLATANAQGRPSIRTVLLKSWDEQGFVFYTNYKSKKGLDLAENPFASLLFYWESVSRQIRIDGSVAKVDDAESEAYFNSRPLESRKSAIVSNQSQIIKSRQELEVAIEQLSSNKELKRPEQWGGYSLQADYFEFWQGRPNRLHDRIAYSKQGNGNWNLERLAP